MLVLPFSVLTDAFFCVASTADHSTHCLTAATPTAFSVMRQVPYLSLAQVALAAVQSSLPVAFYCTRGNSFSNRCGRRVASWVAVLQDNVLSEK